MRKSDLLRLSSISLAIASTFALKVHALEVDSRITQAGSFKRGIENFASPPPLILTGEHGFRFHCGNNYKGSPGINEAQEAFKSAELGNYMGASQTMSLAIDNYDKAGNVIETRKQKFWHGGTQLDRGWLVKRAYYYRKCGRDELALEDLNRAINDSRTNEESLAFAAYELIRYNKFQDAEFALKRLTSTSNGWIEADYRYLLGLCQEMQAKTDNSADNYFLAAQLFLVNDEKEAANASLEKVRKLSSDSKLKNIKLIDLKSPRGNVSKILSILDFLVNSQNCFDTKKLSNVIGPSFGIDSKGNLYKSINSVLPQIIVGGKISDKKKKQISISILKHQCSIFKTDVIPLLRGRVPLLKPGDKLKNRTQYSIPSGRIVFNWNSTGLQQLASIQVLDKSSGEPPWRSPLDNMSFSEELDWDPKEYIKNSEMIFLGEYKGPDNSLKSGDRIDFFRAKYKPVTYVKGPKLSVDAPIWHETRIGGKAHRMAFGEESDNFIPRYGSKWILFIENAAPDNGAFRTFRGARGRIQFTESNWDRLMKEIEKLKQAY
ncbi:MAG: hypothetical protein KIT34_09950 [Cyanobacteria bacterium TGS_CYA1]|nr:hypothetical protein [Cyanobacteria bacterium TGS_CYA1]